MNTLRMSEEQLHAYNARRARECAVADGRSRSVDTTADSISTIERVVAQEMARVPTITCEQCGALARRTAPTQRYCAVCSEKRDLVRKRLWAQEHPQSAEATRPAREARGERQRETGRELNAAEKELYGQSEAPDLAWMVRVAVPFSYAASKNHMFAMIGVGHRALRGQSRVIRNHLRDELVVALGRRRLVPNKVWLGIYVEKPNHKGDAVNVIDLVCDAVKEAVRVDDRWFCIRRLDWQIVKKNPRLFVDVGQEEINASHVCSYCGRIRPLSEFGLHKSSSSGKHRVCAGCRGTMSVVVGEL
ncbi:MAG: hypothetical protein ACREDY_06475 [Bradyrhizobium sp.]